MSSLQRALQASKSKVEKRTTEYETANGKFEACFANGLDLSEFSAATSNNNNNNSNGGPKKIISASAELLRVKKIEMEKQRQDELEERRMEGVLQQRAKHVQQSIVQKRHGGQNNVVLDALVKMHDSDHTTSTTSHNKRKKMKNFSAKKSNQVMKKVVQHGSKRQVHKKSRKPKF